MGLIREPKGVDFVIQSTPLSDEERKEISAFIEERKIVKNEKQDKGVALNSVNAMKISTKKKSKIITSKS